MNSGKGLIAPLVQSFFTDHLVRQRRASPQTVASYRDTFRYTIRAAACRRHSEQAGPVDDDCAEIVSTIRAVPGRHRKGLGRMHTGGGQLETVDPASCPSALPGRAGIELGGPENGHGPAGLRDSLDPGTFGLARR